MAIGAAAVLALALVPVGAFAQDDMGDDMSGSMVPHPAHIHEGLCPDPGGVVVALNDVTVAGNDSQGVAEQIHVDVSVTTVELPLDAILAADHAINVHQSADDMATYIACGNIGGHLVEGSFVVGLGPVGASGYSGIAWLTDLGDGTTEVRVAITATGASARMDDDDDMDDDDMDDSDDDTDDDDMDDDGSDDDMDDDDMDDDADEDDSDD
jgi:hypothetical protein